MENQAQTINHEMSDSDYADAVFDMLDAIDNDNFNPEMEA